MKKKLKKWGNSLVAVFTKEDQEIYGLTEGDIIDFEDMLLENPKINSPKEIKSHQPLKKGDSNLHKEERINVYKPRRLKEAIVEGDINTYLDLKAKEFNK